MRKKTLVAGCIILTIYIIIAVAAPVLAPHDPLRDRAVPHQPPSLTHILGTNDIGGDIFSELMLGAGQSLLIGFSAAAISLTIGALFGVMAGWFGGWVDECLTAIGSLFITIPFLPLVIIISAMAGGGRMTPAIILGLLGWPETARVLRSQTFSLREKAYIQDIRAMGAGTYYILTRHVLRSLVPMLVYRFVIAFRTGVLTEATLSFLGLGSPLVISWGNMLYFAQVRSAFLTGAWRWWVIPPGAALMGLVFALLLISYYFEQASDARLESSRHGHY